LGEKPGENMGSVRILGVTVQTPLDFQDFPFILSLSNDLSRASLCIWKKGQGVSERLLSGCCKIQFRLENAAVHFRACSKSFQLPEPKSEVATGFGSV
jgi:hypothetical protein